MRRLGVFRTVCRIATNGVSQCIEIYEVICLTAQVIGNHGRLCCKCGDNTHLTTFALDGSNEGAEITIP